MELLTGIVLLRDDKGPLHHLKVRLMFETTAVDVFAADYVERRKLIKLTSPETRFVERNWDCASEEV